MAREGNLRAISLALGNRLGKDRSMAKIILKRVQAIVIATASSFPAAAVGIKNS